ncbi:MAG: DUF2513 domain-containing protein [Cetobacterium sp.]
MKLNPNCIRDILLYVESNTDFFKTIIFKSSKCEEYFYHKYSKNEIIYHLSQCKNFGYITTSIISTDGSTMIKDLTPIGHTFLENTRDSTIWEKTSEKFKESKIQSIGALLRIAEAVAANYITKLIGE